MQSLRDAAILLGLLIVLTSVRVTRIGPGPATLGLVPPAHAGVAADAPGSPTPASLEEPAPAAPAAPLSTAVGGCTGKSVKVLRVERIKVDTIDLGRGVLAVTVDPQSTEHRVPVACKIG